MELDFQLAPKEFWPTVGRLRREKLNPVHTVFRVGRYLRSGRKVWWSPALKSGLWMGSTGKCLVARPLSLVSSRAQLEKKTWIATYIGPAPTGGPIEFRCYVDRVAVRG